MMKRSALKRTSSLKARTKLKSKTRLRPVSKKKKTHRLILSPEDYAVLREQVLARDGYKCRVPGCTTSEFFVAPHHKVFRSHQGDDADYNLVTLCQICHADVHAYRLKINGEHPDWTFERKSSTISPRDPTGESS